MKKIEYKKINAFTSKKSAGNPAACLYLSQSQKLSDKDMLGIAKEHKGFVAELVFCSQNSKGNYMLQYYSSEGEVEFCGHATIACMYDLFKNNNFLSSLSEVTIKTKFKGDLKVYNHLPEMDSVFITAPDPIDIETSINIEEVAKALRIAKNKIATDIPIQAISAGLKTLIVPIASLHDILAITPKIESLLEFVEHAGVDIILVCCREVADKSNMIRSRVFAPKFGYLEDMATGSGNGALGYYMIRHGIWDRSPGSIEQNGEKDQYNRVYLQYKSGKILFGGSCTVKIAGYYIIDDSK